MWYSYVRLNPLSPPCLHPWESVCLRVWIFILFGCGFTLVNFIEPIWLLLSFFWVGCLLITRLNCSEHLSALYGLLFSTLGAGSVSHHFISFFSEKILISCCKSARFLSPISSIGVACAGFPQNFLYRRLPLWWRLLSTWRVFWLIVKKNLKHVCWSLCPHIWDINLVCMIAIHERFNVKTSYSMKLPRPALSWLLMENYLVP